jgi:putative transposase
MDSPWRQFLRTPAATMLACDFSPWTPAVTLQRLYCLFVMEVNSRYVHIVGMTAHPDGLWTVQQLRNLLRDLDARRTVSVSGPRPSWAVHCTFDALLTDAGIAAVKIPPRSPHANAFASGSCSRSERT